MDTYQFIAALVASLAWPVSAVGITIFLRRPLIGLLERTQSAEGFGAKFTFGKQLEETREKVEDFREAQLITDQGDNQPPALPAPLPNPALVQLSDELASTSATGSIIASWIELERGLQAIAEFNQLDWDERNFISNIRMFRTMDYLPDTLYEAVLTLRRIRNEAAHVRGEPPTLKDAESFRSTVRDILDTVGLNAGLHAWR